eukprot:TRINITY_DN20483_c0_g1_i2.p1 TRINITY_DN20483_c0_g1~~TRINITY_DN20483_c0_g1_i2.p1  ORF type:complete len:776 (+),score=124.33 TRINITY_DN20483_c0_g1_i2:57-2384(+)
MAAAGEAPSVVQSGPSEPQNAGSTLRRGSFLERIGGTIRSGLGREAKREEREEDDKSAVKRVMKNIERGVKSRAQQRDHAIAVWRCRAEVHNLAVFPEHRWVVVGGGAPYTMQVWQLREPREPCFRWPCGDTDTTSEERLEAVLVKTIKGHNGNIKALRRGDHDGARAASDGRCVVWDPRKWKKRCVLGDTDGSTFRPTRMGPTHEFEVLCVCPLLSDAQRVATASADKTIKVWDFEANKCISTLRGHVSSPLSVASSASEVIFSGSRSGRIRIWDLRLQPRRAQVGTLGPGDDYGAHSAATTQLRYHRDRDELISASFDCLAKAWTNPAQSHNDMPVRVFRGHRGIIRGLALGSSPESANALVTCSVNKTVRLWSLHDASNVASVSLPGWANSVEILDDMIVTGLQDHQVSVFSAKLELCNPDLTRRPAADVGHVAASPTLTVPRIGNMSVAPSYGMQRMPQVGSAQLHSPPPRSWCNQGKTFVVVCAGERDGRTDYYRRRTAPGDLDKIDSAVRDELCSREAARMAHRQIHSIMRGARGSNAGTTAGDRRQSQMLVRWDPNLESEDTELGARQSPALRAGMLPDGGTRQRSKLEELRIERDFARKEVKWLREQLRGQQPEVAGAMMSGDEADGSASSGDDELPRQSTVAVGAAGPPLGATVVVPAASGGSPTKHSACGRWSPVEEQPAAEQLPASQPCSGPSSGSAQEHFLLQLPPLPPLDEPDGGGEGDADPLPDSLVSILDRSDDSERSAIAAAVAVCQVAEALQRETAPY